MPNKIEINLSSTALGKVHCIKNFQEAVINGYKELPSAKIVYGIAFHKFIDTMYQTKGDYGRARKKMIEAFSLKKEPDAKSIHMMDERHLTSVCFTAWNDYCEQDKNTFDMFDFGEGKVSSEITFSIPYYEDDYIKVNLCGTIDRLGQFKGGCFSIRDWKTTSFYGKNKSYYFNRYELARQPRFYILSLKLLAKREPDSVLGKIGKTNMGMCYDGVFLKPNQNETEIIKSEVFQYTQKELDEFRRSIDDKIKHISFHIKENYFPKEGIINGTCEGKFGNCPFWNVCKNPDHLREIILKDFIQVPFNPLDYNSLD